MDSCPPITSFRENCAMQVLMLVEAVGTMHASDADKAAMVPWIVSCISGGVDDNVAFRAVVDAGRMARDHHLPHLKALRVLASRM